MALRDELIQPIDYSALPSSEQDELANATLRYHNIKPTPKQPLPCKNESLYRCIASPDESDQFPSASLKVGANERVCMKFSSGIPCDRYSPVITLDSVLKHLSQR